MTQAYFPGINQEKGPRGEPTTIDPTADQRWHLLYRIGAITGLLSVFVIACSIAVFIVWPPPTTVLDHFTRLQENWFLGLLGLDLLYLFSNIFAIPLFLALYVALRPENESLMLVAIVLTLLGVLLLFTIIPALEMLTLSNGYAVATTEMQRTTYLAAGEALLARYTGTTYHAHYIIGAIGLLLVCVVMLQSKVFSKVIAYVGIITNVVAFGLYVPEIGIALSAISGIGYWIWFMLIIPKLLQLAKRSSVSHVR